MNPAEEGGCLHVEGREGGTQTCPQVLCYSLYTGRREERVWREERGLEGVGGRREGGGKRGGRVGGRRVGEGRREG